MSPKVSMVMGSDSDLGVMKQGAEFLRDLGVDFELSIVSAHRTPERLYDYAKNAHKRGIKVIIAGAGGAAHLPGMIASLSPLPVIGVPIKSSNSIDGWDSILSILQMPSGIPVATVALNGSKNAAILASQILGTTDQVIQNKIQDYKSELKEQVKVKFNNLDKVGWENYRK